MIMLYRVPGTILYSYRYLPVAGIFQGGTDLSRQLHHTHPGGKKTLLSINCINLKQFTMVHYRIQVRTDTTGTVQYLTDTQSINQLLMSCQCTKIYLCKGREKRRFFPPTQLGTESKGKEVSGFQCIIQVKLVILLYIKLDSYAY